MAVIIASTTVSVLRQNEAMDAYDRGLESPYAVVTSGIRASILPDKVSRHLPEGASVVETARMSADPIPDLRDSDRILDESTGEVYDLENAVTNVGMLIPITRATLVKIARVH